MCEHLPPGREDLIMIASIKLGVLCAGLEAKPPRTRGSKPSIVTPERPVVGHLEAYLSPHTDTGYLRHRDTGQKILCTMLRMCVRGE
jgi:hypothetical protein